MHPSFLSRPPLVYISCIYNFYNKKRLLRWCFRSQSAQWSPPLAFPRVPHSCAALATQVQHVPNSGGHPHEVTCHVEACTTIPDCFWPPDPVGFHAAHHFCFWACRNCVRPTKLNTDAPATTPALYTTPHAVQRPARLCSPLHTSTNPAYLRHIP